MVVIRVIIIEYLFLHTLCVAANNMTPTRGREWHADRLDLCRGSPGTSSSNFSTNPHKLTHLPGRLWFLSMPRRSRSFRIATYEEVFVNTSSCISWEESHWARQRLDSSVETKSRISKRRNNHSSKGDVWIGLCENVRQHQQTSQEHRPSRPIAISSLTQHALSQEDAHSGGVSLRLIKWKTHPSCFLFFCFFFLQKRRKEQNRKKQFRNDKFHSCNFPHWKQHSEMRIFLCNSFSRSKAKKKKKELKFVFEKQVLCNQNT